MTAWSRERPTVKGFYWYRGNAASAPSMVHMASPYTVHFTSGLTIGIDELHGEFQGPLEPKE